MKIRVILATAAFVLAGTAGTAHAAAISLDSGLPNGTSTVGVTAIEDDGATSGLGLGAGKQLFLDTPLAAATGAQIATFTGGAYTFPETIQRASAVRFGIVAEGAWTLSGLLRIGTDEVFGLAPDFVFYGLRRQDTNAVLDTEFLYVDDAPLSPLASGLFEAGSDVEDWTTGSWGAGEYWIDFLIANAGDDDQYPSGLAIGALNLSGNARFAVPEPGTLGLAGLALVGVLVARRRRRV